MSPAKGAIFFFCDGLTMARWSAPHSENGDANTSYRHRPLRLQNSHKGKSFGEFASEVETWFDDQAPRRSDEALRANLLAEECFLLLLAPSSLRKNSRPTRSWPKPGAIAQVPPVSHAAFALAAPNPGKSLRE